MELRDYVNIVRRGWLIITASVLLAVGVAGAYTLVIPPKYQAVTKSYVSVPPRDGATVSDLSQNAAYAKQAIISYLDIIGSTRVLNKVVTDLKLSTTAAELAGRVNATSPLDSSIIVTTVTGSDAKQAAAIANSVDKNFQSVVVDLQKSAAKGTSFVKVDTIQPAVVPVSQLTPNVRQNLALGILVGLVIGFGAAAIRSIADHRMYELQEIEELAGKPILGAIPVTPKRKGGGLALRAQPRGRAAESFRSLRTNLRSLDTSDMARTLVFTSAVPAQGKTVTVANLAIALAEAGASVVLVDADLRRPKLAGYTAVANGVGLTEVLAGEVDLPTALQEWTRSRLCVLPAGRVPGNPSELLGSETMATVLKKLSGQFDYVLIDTPPLLVGTDAAVLSTTVAGVILVAASGRIKRDQWKDAIRALKIARGNLLGVVVTGVPSRVRRENAYGGQPRSENGTEATLLPDDSMGVRELRLSDIG